MRKIYWAAPLHDEEDRKRNDMYVAMLRKEGHLVYVPQEHGVWEDFPNPQEARKMLFKLDMDAMRQADTCIGCCGNIQTARGPSEGMLWEMGWMTAANKEVILFNDHNYWEYNLMIEYGSSHYFSLFDDVLTFLKEQSFERA